jgi:hypothetical protein
MRNKLISKMLMIAFTPAFAFSLDLTSGLSSALSSFGSNQISSAAGATSSIQCKGIQIPNFGINISSILSSLSLGFGNCNAAARNRELQCLNSKLNILRNPKSSLPTTAIERGVRENIITETCNKGESSVALSSTLRSGYSIVARGNEEYQRCLGSGGGAECSSIVAALPADKTASKKEVIDTVSILTAARGNQFSGAAGQERAAQKALEMTCSTGSCVGKAAQNYYQPAEKSTLDAIRQTSSGELVLLKDATSQPFYIYNGTEEAVSMMPVEQKKKYKTAAIRTNATEAFLSSLSVQISSVEAEIAENASNKNKVASSPILLAPIANYVSSLSAY